MLRSPCTTRTLIAESSAGSSTPTTSSGWVSAKESNEGAAFAEPEAAAWNCSDAALTSFALYLARLLQAVTESSDATKQTRREIGVSSCERHEHPSQFAEGSATPKTYQTRSLNGQSLLARSELNDFIDEMGGRDSRGDRPASIRQDGQPNNTGGVSIDVSI